MCGDDRDVTISRWNQLQAMWGSGTGLSMHGKTVYTPENVLCRFKTVSYNQIPNCEDTDGYVSLLIKSSCKDVLAHKLQIHEKLHQLLNNQIHTIEIQDIQPAIKSCNNVVQPQQPKATFGFLSQPTSTAMPTVTSNAGVEYTDVSIRVIETVNGNITCIISIFH